jgi:hypothetical protein
MSERPGRVNIRLIRFVVMTFQNLLIFFIILGHKEPLVILTTSAFIDYDDHL